jgi:hypothetical protein
VLSGRRRAWLGGLLLLLAACSADRIERGVFHSGKGYRIAVPIDGWIVVTQSQADLELRRTDPPGGMLVDATCEGSAPRRSLGLLARYLTFGLDDRTTLASEPATVGGGSAIRTVVRGRLDGQPVTVEAVVVKGGRCVYDLLYVAPPEHFESGVDVFRNFSESLAIGGPEGRNVR